ncbi:MAG: hypothetical protein FJX31_02715 [Alphaproteobacteria bacterium]|nr:hypothetical protein [Alphaproteobacteria bacterium]
MEKIGARPAKGVTVTAAPGRGSPGIAGMPVWRLAEMIASGDFSPVEVTEAVLTRTAERDGEVRAFRTVTADAARQAAQDAERAVREGRPLGLQHGGPIALKEHIPVSGCNYWNSFDDSHSIAQQDGIEIAEAFLAEISTP